MKLEQLSDATVLRRNAEVKKKSAAHSGRIEPRIEPVVKIPVKGTILVYQGRRIPAEWLRETRTFADKLGKAVAL